MEISNATMQTAQRLMQAWESSVTPAGAGQASDTRSPVPAEVANDFAQRLEVRADSASSIGELPSAATPEVPQITPEELYAVTFTAHMARFEAEFFSTVQKSVTDNFTQTLKNKQ